MDRVKSTRGRFAPGNSAASGRVQFPTSIFVTASLRRTLCECATGQKQSYWARGIKKLCERFASGDLKAQALVLSRLFGAPRQTSDLSVTNVERTGDIPLIKAGVTTPAEAARIYERMIRADPDYDADDTPDAFN